MAEQSSLLDQEAIKAIKGEVKRIQDERLKMEEELAFLRGIVSTDPNKKGLRIQKFKLEHGLEKEQYTYRFTVSQVINSGLLAKGSIYIRVEGLKGGQSRVLNLDELTSDNQKSVKMRFKFFQNVEGTLNLPADFSPSTVTIDVQPANKKLAPVSEVYDWEPIT